MCKISETISSNYFISININNDFIKFHYYLHKLYKCKLYIIKLIKCKLLRQLSCQEP